MVPKVKLGIQAGSGVRGDMQILEAGLVFNDQALEERIVGVVDHKGVKTLHEVQHYEDVLSFWLVLPVDHESSVRCLFLGILQAAPMHK